MNSRIDDLRRFIIDHYSLDELRTLCFISGVNYDELGGEGISAKARELVLFAGRRGRLSVLLAELAREQPDAFREAGFSLGPETLEEVADELAALARSGDLERLPDRPAQRPAIYGIDWQNQAPVALQDHFTDFTAYVEDKTDGFVGRRFVFDALDNFLDEEDSGYFVIRGDPGIGKSALAAQLVKSRGYPHHFNIASEGISGKDQFYENSSAQLIACYDLGYLDLPAGMANDPRFFKQILSEAAAADLDRPVVLIVDALDEVASDPGAAFANPLNLPRSLPGNAYIIVTTRRTDEVLEIDVENSRVLELEADSDGNLRDVWAYIENYARRPEMQSRLAAWRVDGQTFIRKLRDKSQGNFMYLRHVLPAIAAGRFTDGTIDELPRGLRKYYERHWQTMRGQDAGLFVRVNQKVIAVLATARRPVSVQFVARVTGLQAAEVRWTIEGWREFLHEVPGDGVRHYRIYHASYRDFLATQVVG